MLVAGVSSLWMIAGWNYYTAFVPHAEPTYVIFLFSLKNFHGGNNSMINKPGFFFVFAGFLRRLIFSQRRARMTERIWIWIWFEKRKVWSERDGLLSFFTHTPWLFLYMTMHQWINQLFLFHRTVLMLLSSHHHVFVSSFASVSQNGFISCLFNCILSSFPFHYVSGDSFIMCKEWSSRREECFSWSGQKLSSGVKTLGFFHKKRIINSTKLSINTLNVS